MKWRCGAQAVKFRYEEPMDLLTGAGFLQKTVMS